MSFTFVSPYVPLRLFDLVRESSSMQRHSNLMPRARHQIVLQFTAADGVEIVRLGYQRTLDVFFEGDFAIHFIYTIACSIAITTRVQSETTDEARMNDRRLARITCVDG
jgi:hypothetical protein